MSICQVVKMRRISFIAIDILEIPSPTGEICGLRSGFFDPLTHVTLVADPFTFHHTAFLIRLVVPDT